MKQAFLYALTKKRVWAGVIALVLAGTGAHLSPPVADVLAGVIAEIFAPDEGKPAQ